MLESTADRQIKISVVVNGGAAQRSGIMEGDVIESIDGQPLGLVSNVESCSEYIRGPAGSYIQVHTSASTPICTSCLTSNAMNPYLPALRMRPSLASAHRAVSDTSSASSENQFLEALLKSWVPCSRALVLCQGKGESRVSEERDYLAEFGHVAQHLL